MTRPGLIITAGVLALLAPSVAVAETPEASALAHNAAYEAATKSGLSPQTLSEMLTCAAMWERWDYAVISAADPKFAGTLRRELSSANAKKRKIYWQRLARREMNEDDDAAYFEKTRSRAEESADKLYAAYATNDAAGTSRLIEWLGICK